MFLFRAHRRHLSHPFCTSYVKIVEPSKLFKYNILGGDKMDIQFVEHKETSLQIIIKCKQIDNQILQLKSHIELFDNKLSAKKDHELFLINSSDVLYFESVDNRTFLYTINDVLEINQRLYELENILSPKDFARISKSQIVNMNKIISLKPELNRTILATMCNNEKLSISRKYVKTVRSILSI